MRKIILFLAFIMASGLAMAQEGEKTPESKKYELVERNRRGHFVAGDSYIKQEGKVIGNYAVEPIGETAKKFTFTLPNGTVVAEGVLKHNNAGKMVVQTKLDEKMHTVGLKNIADIDVAREVGMFLSDNKYL